MKGEAVATKPACGCQTCSNLVPASEASGIATDRTVSCAPGQAGFEGICSAGKDSEDTCGCCHDHGEGMKPHQKASLAVAGIFVASALFFEHILGNELLMLVSAGIAIVAGFVIVLPKTLASLKALSIDINVLMVVAIIGAVYVQAYEEAAAVLFLFSVGEYLEGRALRKSNDAIKDLAKLVPDTALVIRQGHVAEVPTDQVAKGETIAVKPGMSVPLDGVIAKGSSSFDDAAITGESLPVYKTVGDSVFAASLAIEGSCEIETTSTVADSTLAKVATMVAEAQKQKSSREHFVERFAKVYTPIVIVVAALIALIPSLVTVSGIADLGSPQVWIYRACELLVISCPCAFVISTPVTMVSALTRAAKMGVLVKGGAFFEEGARIKVAAFDKTGTLTEGRPVVDAVVPALPTSDEAAWHDAGGAGSLAVAERTVAVAAALEAHSTHPLGKAVLSYAELRGIEHAGAVEDMKETAGKGIVGVIGGASYAVGSPSYLQTEHGFGSELSSLLEAAAPLAGTSLVVARIGEDPQILGAIIVSDAIRKETPYIIEALHSVRKGLKAIMLTGDNAQAAFAVADKAGVDEVHASLLPQGKTEQIKRIQQMWGPVAYTGDGINDAPSLAAADVGIAMGGAGSSAALSSADVVLMADDLSALPKFLALSSKTIRILKQNVVLAIGLKALVALLVVIGVAQMWMAVLADTGVSLLVILNGMRLLRTRL